MILISFPLEHVNLYLKTERKKTCREWNLCHIQKHSLTSDQLKTEAIHGFVIYVCEIKIAKELFLVHILLHFLVK